MNAAMISGTMAVFVPYEVSYDLCDPQALDKAVATRGGDRRWTRLADRLRA